MIRRVAIWCNFLPIVLLYGCEDCNDCKDLQQKSIKVVDASGTDLLFGTQAVYVVEALTLTGGGISQALFINEQEQSLQFFLEEDITAYTLLLDANTKENITFELSERDSERCCGTQTISMATQVNGVETANNDTIIIIK